MKATCPLLHELTSGHEPAAAPAHFDIRQIATDPFRALSPLQSGSERDQFPDDGSVAGRFLAARLCGADPMPLCPPLRVIEPDPILREVSGLQIAEMPDQD